MEDVLTKFLRYAVLDTQSSSKTQTHPSTAGQLALGRLLAEELANLGMTDVKISEHGVVSGRLAATKGCEEAPTLGLIAHMDTSEDAPGHGVKPQLVRYAGGILPLGNGKRQLSPEIFPELKEQEGEELLVTDGTTLLGADDKAGIAAIVAAAEMLVAKNLAHGELAIGFTPDEEIGEGVLFFDTEVFAADYAYTVDGGSVREIEYQNFNAAEATLIFHGRSVHPGAAKGKMRNALLLAMQFDRLLPQEERPEKTEKMEGFHHLLELSGNVSEAKARYLLREHDTARFEKMKLQFTQAAERLNKQYNSDAVAVTIREQYRNMAAIIEAFPFLLTEAQSAIRAAGFEPRIVPIRGGTDGAMLSFRGLPCPNLGAGGYNFHGEYEYLNVRELRAAVPMLIALISGFSQRQKPSR